MLVMIQDLVITEWPQKVEENGVEQAGKTVVEETTTGPNLVRKFSERRGKLTEA